MRLDLNAKLMDVGTIIGVVSAAILWVYGSSICVVGVVLGVILQLVALSTGCTSSLTTKK